MGISVASSETSRTPEQARTAAHIKRGGGSLGIEDEMQKLFEELMGGDVEGAEGSEEFDWEGLWNSLMGDEQQTDGQQENVQGSQYPTMFGNPNTPLKFNYY